MDVTMLTTPTCIKCKNLKPVIEKVCTDRNVECKVLNALEESELVKEFNIMSVPFIIFKDNEGNVVKTCNDFLTEAEIVKILDNE